MAKASKTLQAIDAFCLAQRDTENRKHLGASKIGHKCAREVWYSFRWAGGKVPEAKMVRLWARGHREEPQLIKYLEGIGVTVWSSGETGENKEALRITDHGGHFGGTGDGVGIGIPDLPKDEPALLEFKTYNDKRFKELAENGVEETAWVYFVQVHIYMTKLGLKNCLFVASNKNTDELYLEIIPKNEKVASRYLARAGEIIRSEEPPPRISDSPGWYECRYCDFAAVCHFPDQNPPAINCRTCAHATADTTTGKWTCARERGEIVNQRGCPEHLYDPRWFPDWEVIAGDFKRNCYTVKHHTGENYIMGPSAFSSKQFFQNGLPPF
jgi:hypothetical protein